MMEKQLFELVLLVDIEAYSLKEYTLHLSTTQKSCSLVTLEYFNEKDKPLDVGPFKTEIIEKKIVKLTNRLLSVSFSKTGSILNVQHLKHDEKVSFTSDAIFYGTSTQSDHNSGAYLFIPDGDAQEIPMGNHDLVRIQRGSLVNRFEILHEMYGLQYSLTNTNGPEDNVIEVGATTHLNMNRDIELALRFKTGIQNGDEFFTDLNGFQVFFENFFF